MNDLTELLKGTGLSPRVVFWSLTPVLALLGTVFFNVLLHILLNPVIAWFGGKPDEIEDLWFGAGFALTVLVLVWLYRIPRRWSLSGVVFLATTPVLVPTFAILICLPLGLLAAGMSWLFGIEVEGSQANAVSNVMLVISSVLAILACWKMWKVADLHLFIPTEPQANIEPLSPRIEDKVGKPD